MSTFRRTLNTIEQLTRSRTTLSLYYRGDLAFRLASPVVELGITYLFFDLIYRAGPLQRFAPWNQILWLLLLAYLVDSLFGFLFTGLHSVSERVRSGQMDVLLLWPVDQLALLSLWKVNWLRLVNSLAALPLLIHAWSLSEMTPGRLAAGGLLLILGLGIRYHLSLLASVLSLWIVRADAVVFVIDELNTISRYPAAVFRGLGRIFLLYICPVLLVANPGARVLSGDRLMLGASLWALAFNLLGQLLARWLYRRCLSEYASAGG